MSISVDVESRVYRSSGLPTLEGIENLTEVEQLNQTSLIFRAHGEDVAY